MADKLEGRPAAMTWVAVAAIPKYIMAAVSRSRSNLSTAEMVKTAIKSLRKRSGLSFKAIKKYVCQTYSVDDKRYSPLIKKYLNSAVAAGTIIQTRGKGASGSFRLAAPPKSQANKQKKPKWKQGTKKTEAKTSDRA